jgi:hypothetical protein
MEDAGRVRFASNTGRDDFAVSARLGYPLIPSNGVPSLISLGDLVVERDGMEKMRKMMGGGIEL